MIGRPIRKGEQFNTDVLLGKSYHIMVSNTPEDERGRIFDNVENVHRIRPKEGQEPAKTDEPENPEEDLDDIPW